MQVLRTHGKAPLRLRPWVIVLAAVVAIALVVGLTHGGGKPPKSGRGSGSGGGNADTGKTSPASLLSLASSSPAAGAQNVASNTTIKLNFSAPVSLGGARPTLSPPVAGTWVQSSRTTLAYDLASPLVPSSSEVVTVPGGSKGLEGSDGDHLAASSSVPFTVAQGDPLRLQQLLAELDFLPLGFTPSGPAPAPQDMAEDQSGNLSWRWPGQPAQLTSLWVQGSVDQITKAAIESFENQNNLTVDGLPGPEVWRTLLADVAAIKVNDVPYVYVLVNKVRPENLTLWENGNVDLSNILVNTGAPGADTTDGTYAVFEHERFSDMKGTNPNGSTYNDPNVPYASYFNGGDALHGFIRATYGSPQSNGCVEMAYTNAALVFPLTPIGTLVTVEGPATPGLPPPATTTTTTAPTATTTVPPPTTTPTTAPATSVPPVTDPPTTP